MPASPAAKAGCSVLAVALPVLLLAGCGGSAGTATVSAGGTPPGSTGTVVSSLLPHVSTASSATTKPSNPATSTEPVRRAKPDRRARPTIQAISKRSRRSKPPSISPPAGFSSGTTQPPQQGTWGATGTVLGSLGYSPEQSPIRRLWIITRSCRSQCTYSISRQFVADGRAYTITAQLVHETDGWHATWPPQKLFCGGTAQAPIYWEQQEIWILRFAEAGRSAQANESKFSFTPRCGWGRASLSWRARFAEPSTNPGNLKGNPDLVHTRPD